MRRAAPLAALALLLLSHTPLRAADDGTDPLPPPLLPESFKALTHHRLVQGWVHVHADPRLTLPPAEGDGAPYELEESGVLMQTPFRLRLSPAARLVYRFTCTSGGSGDPSCTLSDGKRGLEIEGDALAFPGDGCVYSVARANQHFSVRRKFCETRAGLAEVAQPARYVGLRSTALADLPLFSDPALKQPSGRIAKGGFVEVLIEQRGRYLLRDEFGFTGWAKLPNAEDPEGRGGGDIAGFFFAGD